jgi:hypothetical protein
MKCDSQASLLAHTFASPCISQNSKAKVMIRYGSYDILMMAFELCNAPTTFTTLMNSILHEKLDEFMIIYINDTLVYSKTTEKHAEHLEYVLSKLKQNKLFANRAKNEFT